MGIQIRYGMVGGHMNAFIGEVHRKAIAFDPRAQLVAGCFSTNAEKNRETGETYSLDMSRVYPSYEAMAEAESRRPDGIDFVSITTPNNTHYDVAKCFLQHGIHVVCEKPLCFTVEQAQELVALAKEKNLVFGVTYTYSGYTMMKVAREMIAEGKIGKIAAVNAEYVQEWLIDELGATGYVFWGGREGYDTLLNTDMGLELDNMARFLRMARDYGRKIGFTGDFYLEPKPKEPTKHQYDFDVATCMNFLRKYDLTADFKMNIEANHATLAGHTFEHELRTAIVNGSFGSIDANEGDYLLGWDTDQFPANVYSATYCMMEVLRAGGFTNGGLNFDAKARRQSNTFEDILLAYISGMDTFALGLRKALELKADGRLDQFVKERYSSYDSGVGKKIVDGEMTLESLADYAEGLKSFDVPSGRQEYLESVVNRVLFH